MLGFFVGVGFIYVEPANWHPFAPNGWTGIQPGAAIVFFAYIGFDAISTAAEETRDPQRDMPHRDHRLARHLHRHLHRGGARWPPAWSPTTQLKATLATEQAEPLTLAMKHVGIGWWSAIVAFGRVVAHTAVLLVFQLGQPRIFFSMAATACCPPWFARVHPRFRTPHVTTILTGVVVALGSTSSTIDEMVDLTNIGTLFAFMLVCVGRARAAHQGPGPAAAVPRALGAGCRPRGRGGLPLRDDGLPPSAWIRFCVWLAGGRRRLLLYGYRHSRLAGRGRA